jgi:hypothetical protein
MVMARRNLRKCLRSLNRTPYVVTDMLPSIDEWFRSRLFRKCRCKSSARLIDGHGDLEPNFDQHPIGMVLPRRIWRDIKLNTCRGNVFLRASSPRDNIEQTTPHSTLALDYDVGNKANISVVRSRAAVNQILGHIKWWIMRQMSAHPLDTAACLSTRKKPYSYFCEILADCKFSLCWLVANGRTRSRAVTKSPSWFP